jgi:thiamine transport system ATP-binding protein
MLDVQNLAFSRSGDLHFHYEFQVQPAEILAIQGPSGVGKTTLLDLIAGFETQDGGSISWQGKAFHNEMPWDRPVTTVFQSDNLFDHLTCEHNVSIGITGTSVSQQRLDSAFVELGIDGLQTRLPNQISGGQQQRVALARALLRDQPMLLLDEGFSALDWDMRTGCFDALKDLCNTRVMSILLVSHDDRDAAYLGCKIMRLSATVP